MGLGLLYEIRLSHSGTRHSVGILRTSDHPDTETSTLTHTTLTGTEMNSEGFEPALPNKRSAADPHLDRWDQLTITSISIKGPGVVTVLTSLYLTLRTSANSLSILCCQTPYTGTSWNLIFKEFKIQVRNPHQKLFRNFIVNDVPHRTARHTN